MSIPDKEKLKFASLEVAMHYDKYSDDFHQWLMDNWHVFEYFETSAQQVWAHGWKHYSARTIWEVMRHRSAVREIEGEFKLNDHRVPDVARLYMFLHPEQDGLFEFRQRRLAA